MIKLLFSKNFCLKEKHSLMDWLRFVTKMAKQMRCGDSKLTYHFQMHRPGSSGRDMGRSRRRAEAGWRLPSPARCGFVWPRLSVAREGTRTFSRSSALPCLQACCPWTLLRVPGLSVAERAIHRAATRSWSALCGRCLLGYVRTQPLCPANSTLLLVSPPKLNHSCP